MYDKITLKVIPLNTDFLAIETLIGDGLNIQQYKNSFTNSTRKCKKDLDYSKVNWNGKNDFVNT